MNIAKAEDTQEELSIRLVLKQLLVHANLSANALAKQLNFPPPTVIRLINGEVQDPRASTLIAIANYFGITIDQLLGRETLPNKFTLISKIKDCMTKPPMSIPILSMAEATQQQTNLAKPMDWFRWQKQTPGNELTTYQDIFAVAIKNNLYEPIFTNGAIIIIDQSINPDSGDYVLVKFPNDSNAAIKKYSAEGSYKYFHPINRELKTAIFNETNCSIIGIIIESYMNFKE